MPETTDQTDITVQDCLKGAFAALLRGDLEERDRLCKLAELGFDGEQTVPGDKSIFETKGEGQ